MYGSGSAGGSGSGSSRPGLVLGLRLRVGLVGFGSGSGSDSGTASSLRRLAIHALRSASVGIAGSVGVPGLRLLGLGLVGQQHEALVHGEEEHRAGAVGPVALAQRRLQLRRERADPLQRRAVAGLVRSRPGVDQGVERRPQLARGEPALGECERIVHAGIFAVPALARVTSRIERVERLRGARRSRNSVSRHSPWSCAMPLPPPDDPEAARDVQRDARHVLREDRSSGSSRPRPPRRPRRAAPAAPGRRPRPAPRARRRRCSPATPA